ncbi:MAG: hypothetical protein ACOXZ4_07715 [Sphaerochaetaceae bacterium]
MNRRSDQKELRVHSVDGLDKKTVRVLSSWEKRPIAADFGGSDVLRRGVY